MDDVVRFVSMSMGIVIARIKIDHPWQEYEWKPTGVLPGAAPIEAWRTLREEDDAVEYHAATLPLELHRKETSAYQVNMQDAVPALYVVYCEFEDEDADDEHPLDVQLVTASPFEAQDYLDSGEVMVERVAMPEGVGVWVTKFIEEFHVEEEFKKRRKNMVKKEDYTFGQEPVVELRKRMNGQHEDG